VRALADGEPQQEGGAINRIRALVLGFLALACATPVAMFAAAPEVYGRALNLSSADARLIFLGRISAFIALFVAGVIWRRRWAF
jgi:hypothetical protein